jgi:molybdopterin synthase catalytic subunit
MSGPRLAMTSEPLSVTTLASVVEEDARRTREGCGALCSFVGTVRAMHQGRRVVYLEYEAYLPLADRTLARIAEEATAEWPEVILGIHHRVGRLEIGEASVVIVAAAAHRAEAIAACRYAIERIKQILPVWKHEFFDDGDVWVEGAQADASDDRLRREALARTCA